MKPISVFRISLFIILLGIGQTVFTQQKIIRYKDFEREYKKNPNLKTLSEKYYLCYILLLDTTYKADFFRYDAEIKVCYEGCYYGLKDNEHTVSFSTKSKKIEDFFSSDLLLKKVLNCIYNTINQYNPPRISYPIYIKNNTAIVNFRGNDFTDTYCFKLENGQVKINWLLGIDE